MTTKSENSLFEDYILIYDSQKYFFNDGTIRRMNSYLKKKNIDLLYDYPHIGGDLNSFANVIIITLPILMQNLAFDAIYDILRHLILLIFQKVTARKVKKRKMEDKPTVYFEYQEEYIKMDFDFDLTEEQQDKIVDTVCNAIQEMIKRKK